MRLLFGKPLHDLAVQDIEAFLSDATEEGLTWEAKGNQQPHGNSVRKAIAGFANAIGGYLVIGAERNADGSGWQLPGVDFRVAEPGTWISSVITSGVSPVPSFESKVFERADGRHVVVVEVEPVPVPPCITRDGVLYQRVSGQTLPVTDQQVLAELRRRGEAARANAEASARRAAALILQEPGSIGSDASLLSVSIRPVLTPDDKAAVIFSKAFAAELQGIVHQSLQVDPMVRYSVGTGMQQDALRIWTSSHELGSSWTAAAYWDGSCAAVFNTGASELYVHEAVARVQQAWKALAEIAAHAGGQGAAHLVVRINEQHAMVDDKLSGAVELRRWTEVRAPSEEELARVERELRRALGETVWEPPVPAPPASQA